MTIQFKVMILWVGMAATVVPATPATTTRADLKTLREQAARKQRRVIMNDDGDSVHFLTQYREDYLDKKIRPPTPSNLLRRRSEGIQHTHIDAIFFNWRPGTGQEDYGDYSVADLKTLINPTPPPEIRVDPQAAWDLWAAALDILINFGRKNGVEVFWSMRMNDTHDSNVKEFPMSKWKRRHPHLLMGKPGQPFPYGAGRWSGMDYRHPEVRDLIFGIFRDICNRHDVDGIEMDFFRHPLFFKPQMTGRPVTQYHCDLMTGLIRRVRIMADEVGTRRGRPILIAVRLPDSVGYCRAIGLDLIRWLKEGLVDLVIGSCYFHLEPWENFVALGKRYDVPVFACISASRLRNHGQYTSRGICEEAWNAWQAGVNGIYTFNLFNPRSWYYRQIGDPKILEKKDLKRDYDPIVIGQGEFGRWLKDDGRFAHVVTVAANQEVFEKETTATLSFPLADYQIHYTLDGSTPTPASAAYTGPIPINRTATLTAMAFSPGGKKSFVSRKTLIRAAKMIRAEGMPLELFNRPVGSGANARITVPELPERGRAGLYLAMGDVDDVKEVNIYINGHGPLIPPENIRHRDQVRTGILWVPPTYFRIGENTLRFVFADDLGKTTSGFSVNDAHLLWVND